MIISALILRHDFFNSARENSKGLIDKTSIFVLHLYSECVCMNTKKAEKMTEFDAIES
jgi:hypothetical protein